MILSIATYKINLLIEEYSEQIFSPFFVNATEKYKESNTSDYDFTLKTIRSEKLPSQEFNMEQRAGIRYLENGDELIFESEYAVSRIDFNKHVMSVLLYNRNFEKYYGEIVLSSIKLLLSLLCIEQGGLPFHCSGVAAKDRSHGFIFSGPSGAGKTTIAFLLSMDWDILNDEFNLILPFQNTYKVYSTPFTTQEKLLFCNKGSAPVQKIFFLKKNIDNFIEELSLKERFFLLLEGTYTFPTTKIIGKKMFDNIETIAAHIPCALLHFNHTSDISAYINQCNMNV